jgi:hypothetical protein
VSGLPWQLIVGLFDLIVWFIGRYYTFTLGYNSSHTFCVLSYFTSELFDFISELCPQFLTLLITAGFNFDFVTLLSLLSFVWLLAFVSSVKVTLRLAVTANQFVLVSDPLRPTARDFFQLNSYGNVSSVSSLSQSHIASDGQSVSKSWYRAPSGAHDQIFISVWQLRSCFRGAPSLIEDGSVFCMCRWLLPAQSFSGPSPLGLATVLYCLRFETSFFVASYDSQGHGGGIRPRLHTG